MADEKGIKQAYARLKAGEDFETVGKEMAINYSRQWLTRSSRRHAGRAGQHRHQAGRPPQERGRIHRALQHAGLLGIMQLVERFPERLMSWDEAKDKATSDLKEFRQNARLDSLLNDWRQGAKIEINERVLRKVEKGPPPNPSVRSTSGRQAPRARAARPRGVPAAAAAALGALVLVLAGGCGGPAEERRGEGAAPGEPLATGVLVRVGGEALTAERFEALLPAQFRGLLTAEEKRAALERWVDTELLYRAAVARGLPDDPELQRILEKQRREFLATACSSRCSRARGGHRERDRRVLHRPPGRVVLGIPLPGDRRRHAHEAKDIYDMIMAKRLGFAEAVQRYSRSGSARLGGDLGWLTKGGLPRSWGIASRR